MSKTIGVYAGSMDPFTWGHLEVVQQALPLFDELYIVIANNPGKTRRFDLETMKAAIAECVDPLQKVKVVYADRLVVDVCTSLDVAVYDRDLEPPVRIFLVRGIRDGVDYGYEEQLARANMAVGGYPTIYFRSERGYISSSLVYELLRTGHVEQALQYVPGQIAIALKKMWDKR